jgi:hypothetical protein
MSHHSHGGVTTLKNRRKQPAENATRKLDQEVDANVPPVSPAAFPYLAELIPHGQITVGVIRPVGCVAIATDGRNSLAMLHRRRGETLIQLLTRLDSAVEKALNEEVFTDEINPKS